MNFFINMSALSARKRFFDEIWGGPRAGGIDTLPVGTGSGVRAWSEETRCPGILTKTGGMLAYARQTLVREMYERCTSVYESLREKKIQVCSDIYLIILDEREQGD